MRLLRCALLVLLVGCFGGGDDVAATPTDDPVLLLGDLQHLLGEAVAAYGADDLATAERDWTDAVVLWRDQVGPTVRAKDPRKALEVEYALGRLGDQLRRGGQRPAVLHKELDRSLRDLEPWLAVPPPPDAGSGVPDGNP